MSIIIAIPIYKRDLNVFEKISLKQLDKVLGKYDKCFIAPESLNFNYGDNYKDYRIEYYPDMYFKNTESYSELMLSIGFYQRFMAYEYMLIYQLDAFVFSDYLARFTNMGLDYIGAPVPRFIDEWGGAGCRVGNGGLSLRRISAVIRLLKEKERILSRSTFIDDFCKAEDLFFAYAAANSINFKAPSINVAAEFSIENNIAHCYQHLQVGKIPFGCHAWHKVNYHIWKPIIENCGYKLPSCDDVEFINTFEIRKEVLRPFLLKRVYKYKNSAKMRNLLARVINADYKCFIWGAGKVGLRCLETLKLADMNPRAVFDSNADSMDHYWHGVEVLKPDSEMLRSKLGIIIIATVRFEKEISARLSTLGLEADKDYITFNELRMRLLKCIIP